MNKTISERQVIIALEDARSQADQLWFDAVDFENEGDGKLARVYYSKAFKQYQVCHELVSRISDYSKDPEFFYFTYKAIGNAYFDHSKGNDDNAKLAISCYQKSIKIASTMKTLPEDKFYLTEIEEKLASMNAEMDLVVHDIIPSNMTIREDTMDISDDEFVGDFAEDLESLVAMNTTIGESWATTPEADTITQNTDEYEFSLEPMDGIEDILKEYDTLSVTKKARKLEQHTSESQVELLNKFRIEAKAHYDIAECLVKMSKRAARSYP